MTEYSSWATAIGTIILALTAIFGFLFPNNSDPYNKYLYIASIWFLLSVIAFSYLNTKIDKIEIALNEEGKGRKRKM